MITSIHTLIYSDDAKATRAFLRDVLGWKYVTEDWDNRVNRFAPRGLLQCGDRARWVCTRRTASGKARLMITHGSTRSRSCAMTSMRRWMSCGRKERSSEKESRNASMVA